MKTLAIIPARYKSSRFEGKPLALIEDKPMIMWVYDSVKMSRLFDEVYIATDDERIKTVVSGYGANVKMTSEKISCGTERCKAVVESLEKEGKCFDVVVNIQGDEPLIQKEQIKKVLEGFNDVKVDIVTLCKQIENSKDIEDENVVKVVFSKANKALYFSRSVVPFNRDKVNADYYKHIGIYGYKTDVLKQICDLTQSSLEKTEKLEQLRWLENDYKIKVVQTHIDSIGVDTVEDLENVKRIINKTI